MKKNGFSLIELLAVILILGVVSSIGVIKSIEMSNDEKKKEFDNLKEIIEENAKLLVSENDDLYKGIASKQLQKIVIYVNFLIMNLLKIILWMKEQLIL